MTDTKNQRPQAAYVVFFSQVMWGFSYYGVYSLLTSFFKKGLEFSEAETISMVAVYGAMGPICTFIGGIISDKLLGIRRSYVLGYFFYTIGFILLGISAMSVGVERDFAISLSFLSIAIISIARGTANSANNIILTKSHQTEDKIHLLDVSYSINYMLNNIGSYLGQNIFPILIGTSFGLIWGYKVAFFIASGLMLVAVMNQLLRYRIMQVGGSPLDFAPLPKKNIVILVGYFIVLFIVAFGFLSIGNSTYFSIFSTILFIGAVLYFISLIPKAEKSYRPKMLIALLIYFQLIVFYIYYNQMFTSLILYPINVMRTIEILGLTINGEFTISFNPFWCVVGSPIVIGIIGMLTKRGREIHVGHKFVIGILLAGLSYFILWYSAITSISSGSQNISMFWIFIGHAFVGIAELFVLNLAISSLSLLVPKNITATTLGMNLLSMGVGSLLAGKIASQIALEPDVTYTPTQIFQVYEPFFLQLTIMAAVCAVLFIGTTYIMKYLEKKAAALESN